MAGNTSSYLVIRQSDCRLWANRRTEDVGTRCLTQYQQRLGSPGVDAGVTEGVATAVLDGVTAGI